MTDTLVIVGAGRVGRALGRRLRESGWKIGAVVTRSEPSARKAVRSIGAGRAHARLTRDILATQVILITTPDHVLPEIAIELARIGAEELQGKIVLQTSGAVSSRVLDPLKNCGAAVGSMHPLQSFSGVEIPPLEGKVFAIEGDPAAIRVARRVARSLGACPVSIAGSSKPLYHAAGALAAGSVLALMEAATRMLVAVGMKRRVAANALLPLTRQVLENFERLGPRSAWTGPLSRGDFGVVGEHFAALKNFPEEFARAYEGVNHLAARVLAHNSQEMFDALERVSSRRNSKAKTSGGHA